MSEVTKEEVLLAMGERVRNARIRDWIEQSPQPKLCEQHKAWSSTSSDYDTALSDLSESGTWENLCSVSMRSALDAEKMQTEARGPCCGKVENQKMHSAGLQPYSELSRRFTAVQVRAQDDEEARQVGKDTFSSNNAVEAKSRPPSYPRSRDDSSRPRTLARRVLDLQACDSPDQPDADAVQGHTEDAIPGLQEIDSGSEQEESRPQARTLGAGLAGFALTLDTTHVPRAVFSHAATCNGESVQAQRESICHSAGTTVAVTPLSPVSPHQGRFSVQHGAVPAYLTSACRKATPPLLQPTPATNMDVRMQGREKQTVASPRNGDVQAKMRAHLGNPVAHSLVSPRPSHEPPQSLVSPRPSHVPPPPSIKHSTDPTITHLSQSLPRGVASMAPRSPTPLADDDQEEEYEDVSRESVDCLCFVQCILVCSVLTRGRAYRSLNSWSSSKLKQSRHDERARGLRPGRPFRRKSSTASCPRLR